MPSDANTPSSTDQGRIQKVQIDGVTVLTLDFSYATPAQTLDMLKEFPNAFVGQAPDSLCLLSDVTGISYDSAISNKWKAARMEFNPYIRASAIYGVGGLVGMAIQSYTELMIWLNLPSAKDKIRVFKTREKALAWLLKH